MIKKALLCAFGFIILLHGLTLSVHARPKPFTSNNVFQLPTEPEPSLSQLRRNCARQAADMDYQLAQKSCLRFSQKLKANNIDDSLGSVVPLCGFYVGLLSERIKYETSLDNPLTVEDLLTRIPPDTASLSSSEREMILLLKAMEININIEKWCQKAAYQKSGYAMEILGDYYEQKTNYEDAIYWYRRAIESYQVAPQNGGITSSYALGILFALAPDALRQPQKAASHLLKSLMLGDDSLIETYLKTDFCKNCLPLATRLHIQKQLKQRGLYNGYIDGDFGTKTINALISLYNTRTKLSLIVQ